MRKATTTPKSEYAPAADADYSADLLIIKRPRGWTPKDFSDTPPSIAVLWTEHERIGLEDALTLQFGHNTEAMADKKGTTWACVIVHWRMHGDA